MIFVIVFWLDIVAQLLCVQNKSEQILNVWSFQIILNEKSLIIEWFSLKIGYKRNQDTEVNWKIYTPKERKGRFGEIVLIFRAKHENKVEAQRSEKLPIKQKC